MFDRQRFYLDKDGGGGSNVGDPPVVDPPKAEDPPKDPPKKEDPPPKDPPGPVPYDRFKEVHDENADLKKRLDDLEKANKDRETKELEDQNRWQELADQRQKELDQERMRNTKLQVAAEKKLPAALIDRLQGDTKEALEADADKLLELMKPEDSKGIPPRKPGGGGNKFNVEEMTPEEIRKNASEIMKN